jgi:hypothetical protein
LPNSAVYDPVSNPTGVRCSAWDWAASIWGTAPGSSHPRDTRDNEGVQYGLKALLAGDITPEEFVVLNEKIGGIDNDSSPKPARTVADSQALATAYRAGIVLSGRQLAKTAIIDMRGWDDSLIFASIPGLTGIHHTWRSFSVRERLDRANGHHDNQVMWRFGRTGFVAPAALAAQAFTTMDQWLTNLKADTSSLPIERKVVNAKPAGAYDYCLLSSDASQSNKVTDQAVCDADPLLKYASSPRQVAGGPFTEDILKCQLRPFNPADYAQVAFTSGQLARLQAVFSTGVCDWTKPGVGQQPAIGPLTFSAGPGGQPLPAAPVSVAK